MRVYKFPAALIIAAFFALLLTIIWYSISSYRSFVENHQQLATRSVHGTARELELLVSEQQRILNLFTTRENALLRDLIAMPGNVAANDELQSKVDVYFPDRFAYTIADKEGMPILRKGQELIGKACRRDINGFSLDPDSHHVYVHPSPKVDKYHFDMMNPVADYNGNTYVFFVSFFLDDLVRVMNHGKVLGHELVLVKEGQPAIIEAKTSDADAILFSDLIEPEHIPSGKKGTVRTVWSEQLNAFQLASVKIGGTYWQLIDIPDQSIFIAKRNELFKQAAWVLLLFAAFAALVTWLLRKLGIAADETKVVINAIDNERKRIAMDLHDQVLSDLAHLRRSYHDFHMNPGKTETALISPENIDEGIGEITDVIRNSINDLHPQSLSLIGLVDTVKHYVNKVFNSDKLPSVLMKVESWDENRLTDDERLHLYRVIQEILANILNHASARNCTLLMKMTDSQLILHVDDDGRGISTSKFKLTGRGKANIKIRSRLLDAEPAWKSGARSGTCFELLMPLGSVTE